MTHPTGLPVTQFIERLNAAVITPEMDVEYSSERREPADCPDDPATYWTTGYLTNVLAIPGLEMSYTQFFEHPKGKPSLVSVSDTCPNPTGFYVMNLVVLDDDGEPLDRADIAAIIEAETKIREMDTRLLGENQYEMDDTDTDTDTEDTDMQTITIERDGDLNIRFTGELVAEASSSDNKVARDYSGSTGRWTVLRLYRSRSGKFVCASEGRTRWKSEHTRYSAAICETEAEVIAFFGTGWLAKELYVGAGIDAVVEVE